MLNLLPPIKKREIRREFKWRRLISFIWMLIFALLIFTGLLVTTWVYSLIQYRAIAHLVDITESTPQNQTIQDIEKAVAETNFQLKYLTDLGLKQPLNFQLLEEIIKLMPEGIVLNSFSLDRSDQQGEIFGLAEHRNLLLIFKEGLESSDYFSQVGLPLSNLLKEEKVDFRLTFSLD